ncbi:fibronectin type III-like domain-contianing protein [Streptomyces sp. NPDC056242]|uniref:fibronectin type III-like domain-contianing protein n=1 Tax=Streptomyces sp. NPDC056242 TaxID=3345760 RepID=UPI0035D7D909
MSTPSTWRVSPTPTASPWRRPTCFSPHNRRTPDPAHAAHERLARQVAQDGIALLKNDKGLLPLPHGELHVFGRALHHFRTTAVGAGTTNARYTVGLHEAIGRHSGFTLNQELAGFYRSGDDAVPGADLLARTRARGDVGIDTVYEEGLYVGYRYFTTFGVEVAYPFGHGLSYTTFSVEPHPPVVDNSTVSLSATVVNEGAAVGREVVQVTVTKPESHLEQPLIELVDFAKTPLLAPDEQHTLAFEVPIDRLVSYDDE